MNDDISIENYIRYKNASFEPNNTKAIGAFVKMITNSFELGFINSNPKETYGYNRHASELYRQLNTFYVDLMHSQYSQDIYQIITYVVCAGNAAPQFCTRYLTEFLKDRFIELYTVQGQMHMSIPMIKEVCSNKSIMYLILQYMVDTFIDVTDFNKLFAVLSAVGEDVKALVIGWKEVAQPVYKDSADLIMKAYKL